MALPPRPNLTPNQPPVAAVDLTKKIAALEARLAALEGMLKTGPGGDVTIKSNAGIRLEAAAGVTVRASGTISIQASATMQLQAAFIAIN